ncbi:hypothetical protein ACF1GY_05580 [Streptomyces sp. NPDC014684]|uniref:hypothetical protein n=1 Tax=Streptomyces sp. NPDC014684 TaxID=3364880 RepID=UPI0036F596FB
MSLQRIQLSEISNMPMYVKHDYPASLVPIDQLASSGLTLEPHRSWLPDAWLVEPRTGGYVHRPAYDLGSLTLVQEAGEDTSVGDGDMSSALVGLDVKELVARSRHQAGVLSSRNGNVTAARGRAYKRGHSLVVAVRATSCCGRLTEIAIQSLFGTVSEHFLLRSEPSPDCPPSSHPRTGLQFRDLIRTLDNLINASAMGADVIVWGSQPVLALHAECVVAGNADPRRPPFWLQINWLDLQGTESVWRTGKLDPIALTAFARGHDAAQDAEALVALVHRIGDSHSERRQLRIEQKPFAPQPPGPTQMPVHLLPIELGSPQSHDTPTAMSSAIFPLSLLEGPTDSFRTGVGRREQHRLRKHLLRGQTAERCALCGTKYPADYLRVAHIKRRADADETERMDTAIVMLACTFGCDQMFELGDIYVDAAGVIRARTKSGNGIEAVAVAAERLVGRKCLVASPDREPYFRHHRQTHGHERSPE